MKIVGSIHHVETVADGSGIRELAGLRAKFGRGNWKKKKGVALVALSDGTQALAEVHWYEAHGNRQGEAKGETMAMKFVVCVNKELEDFSGEDLTIGRVYEALGDVDKHGAIQIIDDSGEDFLYPATCFEPVALSSAAENRLHEALMRISA